MFPVIALPTAMFAAMPAPAANNWQVAEPAMASYETPLIEPPRTTSWPAVLPSVMAALAVVAVMAVNRQLR
jgi:hypothetical protein